MRGAARGRAAAGGIVAAAGAVRGLGIEARGLWLDEAVSWMFASGSPAAVMERLRLDSGPPLYYWLLAAWMRIFGDSEAALRGLSALFGLALVAGLYAVGVRLLGRRAGLIAAGVAALLPIQVRYALEARGYTLVALLGLVAMLTLERWVTGGGRRWLVAHAAAFAALLYSHNYGFFLLAAGGAWAALEGWRRRAPLRALAGLPLALAAYLPWVPVLRAQLANTEPYGWMRLAWEEAGFWGSLAASLRALAPGGGAPSYVGLPAVGALGPLPALAAGAALAGGLYALYRRRPAVKAAAGSPTKGREKPRRGAGAEGPSPTLTWLAAYLLLPPLAVAVYSLLFSPVYLPGRIDQLVVPAFCLAAAAGVAALEPAAVRYAALTLWAGLSVAGLAAYHRAPEAPGERELAAAIAAELGPGDAVLATSLSYAPLTYYLRQRRVDAGGVGGAPARQGAGRGQGPPLRRMEQGGRPPFFGFPPGIADHPGNEDPESLLADPGALAVAAEEVLDAVAASGSRRLWLAFVPNRADAVLLERLLPRAGASRDLGAYRQRLLDREVRLFEVELR